MDRVFVPPPTNSYVDILNRLVYGGGASEREWGEDGDGEVLMRELMLL